MMGDCSEEIGFRSGSQEKVNTSFPKTLKTPPPKKKKKKTKQNKKNERWNSTRLCCSEIRVPGKPFHQSSLKQKVWNPNTWTLKSANGHNTRTVVESLALVYFQVADKFEKQRQEYAELEAKQRQIMEEKNILSEQLQAETELCAEAEEVRIETAKNRRKEIYICAQPKFITKKKK